MCVCVCVGCVCGGVRVFICVCVFTYITYSVNKYTTCVYFIGDNCSLFLSIFTGWSNCDGLS